jgi:Peptidase family C25/Secretion system C-terminal sorting domain
MPCLRPTQRLALCFFACLIFLAVQGFFTSPIFAQSTTQSVQLPLRSPNNSADYLIITPPQFAGELESFVRWRSTATSTHKALRTFVATTTDINKEFLDTTKPQAQAEAIRTFISNALQNWQNPKPRYVVLMGSVNVLPAYRIKVTDPEFSQPPYVWSEDSIPMDNWYVVNRFIQEFNTRPQASIGRIPGRTVAEFRRTLQKIRAFEEFGNWANYNRNARFTSLMDAKDAGMFEDWRFSLFDYLNAKIRKTVSTAATVSTATFEYATVLGKPNAKQATLAAINGGSPCLLYFGHGAPDIWSGYRMITTDDVWNSFARDGRPFMFASLGCSQNYGLSNKLSIVESMMLLENGGAVMSLASSGYSNGPDGRFYLTEFFSRLLTTPGIDVGSAAMLANDRVFEDQGGVIEQDNIYRRFALLGDPAMVPFPRFLTSVQDGNASIQSAAEQLQLSLAPNPTDGASTVYYSLPAVSRVRIEIQSMLGQTLLQQEYTQSAGNHLLTINTENFASGTYLCRLSAGNLSTSKILRVIR